MNQLAVTDFRSRLPMPSGLDNNIDARKWRVLCETTFPTARTPEAIVMALDYCAARGLDIFKRPIHIVPMWNSTLGKEVETIWAGINEIQITAARSRQWAGMDAPEWGPDVTRIFRGRVKGRNGWEDAEAELTYPTSCAVTVYRMIGDQRYAFTEPVFWLEAYSRMGSKSEFPTSMWIKRPRGQLHKVAKAASLRAAFPESGEFTAEEMEGNEIEAGGVVVPEQKRTQKEISAAAAKRWKDLGEIEQDILQLESEAAIERYQREVLTPEAMAALGEKQWAVEQWMEARRREITGYVELEPAGEPIHVGRAGKARDDKAPDFVEISPNARQRWLDRFAKTATVDELNAIIPEIEVLPEAMQEQLKAPFKARRQALRLPKPDKIQQAEAGLPPHNPVTGEILEDVKPEDMF